MWRPNTRWAQTMSHRTTPHITTTEKKKKAHVTVSIFCSYITLLLCHFRLCSPPRCSITAMSQWEEEIFSGLLCIDPRGAIHLQSSGQLFFSARSSQNNPQCPCCKAASQWWQALIYPWTGTLGCDDDTAHTTSNLPQLLLHSGACLFPIRWDKLSLLYVSYYLFLFFSAITVTCSRVIWLFARFNDCNDDVDGEMFIQLTACSHMLMLTDFAPCMFSQFISWKSFYKKWAHFFYFHSHLLKYLSPLIMQNHIFLLILALLSRAQGVDTSTDLQKLERSVLCVRNSGWNLRNRLQTRYVACQQFCRNRPLLTTS